MEETKPIRIYAKKRFGAYPEVDKHILVDLNAKPHERYLVDGEDFKKNLVDARTLVAERLQLKAPQILAATEVHYTPACGYKQSNHRHNKPTDEGNNMNAVADKVQATLPNVNAPQVEVPTGKWADAVAKLVKWETENKKPTEAGAELDTWTKQHKRLQDSVLYQKGVVLGTHKARGPQAGAKKPAPKPLKDEAKTLPPPKPGAALKVKVQTAMANATKPAMSANITFGGLKMSCDTVADLEAAVLMLKGAGAK